MDSPGDAHHGAYGFPKTKKKEKGYKSVGLVSSDEDDDAPMILSSSGPSSSQSAGKSKSKPAFRLKKKKSFKDGKGPEEKGVDELVERTKVKHKSGIYTNPFDDRPQDESNRKSVLLKTLSKEESESQIFAISLAKAVSIDKCPDGIEIPAFFRVCVNYIEDNGMDSVGIYRTSGSQTRIQELKRHFNRGDRVRLNDYEVPTVADVMKLFIRELPERLIPEEILPELEEAIELPDVGKRCDAAIHVLSKLPRCNVTLLGWFFVHMSHVIEHQDQNKMTLRNVASVVEPTLKIQSNKVLNFLLTQPNEVFPDVKITKQGSSAPLPNVATNEALTQLREDLSKKEVLLNHLHHEIKQGKASKRKEEQLWDVQRQVTELKRKIRTLERMTTVALHPTDDLSVRQTREPLSTSTSDQILKPQPAVRLHTRLAPVPTAEPVPPHVETVDETKEPIITEEHRQEMVRELNHQVHLCDALQSHNRHLREKITKENENLVKICDDISQHPVPSPTRIPEETLDRDQLVKEYHDLMGKYQTNKTMTNELNDAICSETAGWIGVMAELNSRKARNSTLGSAV